ncbi:MAG: radical SAM protein [Candidatus Omnitrophota bacterium]
MKSIKIPETYNYIGAFLTLRCNYMCSYCINYFLDQKLLMSDVSGEDWVKGVNRLVSRNDLPVTLQGGEPSLHKDFYYIVNNIKPELNIDILTNLSFDADEFASKIDPQRVKRKAPYASIRVSFHPEAMDLDETMKKTLKLQDKGFYVGIWGVLHPEQQETILKAQEKCRKKGIDFRTKDFLGYYNGKLYGSYRYKDACLRKERRSVLCRTTEFLIAPDLKGYRCHSDLYSGSNAVGSLLDPRFELKYEYTRCDNYGYCNPCDIKVKTNRFQEFGHTSVEIISE